MRPFAVAPALLASLLVACTLEASAARIDDGAQSEVRAPALAMIAGGPVLALYAGAGPGPDRVMARRSFDGGATWTGTAVPVSSMGTAADPDLITLSTGAAVACWTEMAADGGLSVRASRSADQGVAWTSPAGLWSAGSGIDHAHATLAPAGTICFAALTTVPAGGLVVLRSADAGATWVELLHAPDAAASTGTPPAIVASGAGEVAVAWGDLSGRVYLRRSVDDGTSWGTAIELTAPEHRAAHPALAGGSGGYSAALVRASVPAGASEIVVRASPDGATFGPAVRLDDGSVGVRSAPRLVAGGGSLLATWIEQRAAGWELWWSRSSDGGVSWSLAARVAEAEAVVRPWGVPATDLLALSGGGLVAWSDGRDAGGYDRVEVMALGFDPAALEPPGSGSPAAFRLHATGSPGPNPGVTWSSAITGPVSVELIAVNGRLLGERSVEGDAAGRSRVDLASFGVLASASPGIYWLRVRSAAGDVLVRQVVCVR